MKYLLLSSLCFLSVSTFAATNKKMYKKDRSGWDRKMEKMSFEDAKTMRIDMLEKNAAINDDEKKCLNDTKDKPGIKKCMQESWAKHESTREEMRRK